MTDEEAMFKYSNSPTLKKKTSQGGKERMNTGERCALAEAGEKARKERKRLEWAKIPRMMKLEPGNSIELDSNTPEAFALFRSRVREIIGTVDDDAAITLLAQAVVASSGEVQSYTQYFSQALALIYGIEPKDSIEAILAVQMVGTHNLAMKFLERVSMSEGQTEEQIGENINRATKLLRLYTCQVEALSKYRNRGQQKVTVEHVHVNAGGQAIVGTVESIPGGRGRGSERKRTRTPWKAVRRKKQGR